jgi:protein-disulfide isomerase
MKRILLCTAFFLVACSNGGDSESSRTPAGNANASVRVVEFSDLQCPACKSAHEGVVKPILAKYRNEIMYEFRHFPIRSLHRYALDAAEASECAADQGKFWEYIDLVYTEQKSLDREMLSKWASKLSLDESEFNKCLSSHRKRGIALGDYEEGKKKDVNGTPTFFVNGVKVPIGFDTISEAIEKELGPSMPL